MAGVDAACRAGNMAHAMRLAAEAVQRGADHPVMAMLAAHDALARGAADEALALSTRARSLAPRDPEVLNVYAIALVANGRAREALPVYDAIQRQFPGRPGIHFNKGCAYEELNELAKAKICFERAAAAQPPNPQFLGRFAYTAALVGDCNKARIEAVRALRLAPGEAVACLALAMAEIDAKAFDAALTALAPALRGPAGMNRAIAEGLAGDAFDGQGRHDDAFKAYATSNQSRRALYPAPDESARGTAERLAEWFAQSPSWDGGPCPVAARTPVFLLGFPRSGTTLLEQVLAAHPDVETMDERACFTDSVGEFLRTPEGLEKLQTLGDDDCEVWRQAYWARAREYGVVPRKPVFVDKLPINTVCLPLIARLFPGAQVLFALRDPADVVWSCFRRRFGLNAAMYEFLTLDGAARYYDAVMRLADIYRRKLPLSLHEVRYEAFVTDFATESRKVCDALGLSWRADLADFARKAPAVDTPSMAQVARGLYAGAAGQWRAYEKQLSPILPLLAPWRARYGYV